MGSFPGNMQRSKRLKYLILLGFVLSFSAKAQYTDVINSNRPGQSESAYAVGKNVVQAEVGFFYEQQDHQLLRTESGILGSEISLRYGLFFEALEIKWDGIVQSQGIEFLNLATDERYTNFLRNRLGVKFLLFDPYKDPERNKPNIRSWRANNVFQLKNLVPAVSIYAGANFTLGNNPFYPAEPIVSPRAMLATQSRLTPRMVLITNLSYDRIGTDFPEMAYKVSVSRAFRNPKWSMFVEHQGIKSDRYTDLLLRSGVAHLFSQDFQMDINLGASFRNNPSRFFFGLGFSYRLDFHKDTPLSDQKAGENGGPIKRNAMSKKSGKKERRKAKKAAKKNRDSSNS